MLWIFHCCYSWIDIGLLKSSIRSSNLPMADLFSVAAATLWLGPPMTDLSMSKVVSVGLLYLRASSPSPTLSPLPALIGSRATRVKWLSSLILPLMLSSKLTGYEATTFWGRFWARNGELLFLYTRRLFDSNKSLKICSVSSLSRVFFSSISCCTLAKRSI